MWHTHTFPDWTFSMHVHVIRFQWLLFSGFEQTQVLFETFTLSLVLKCSKMPLLCKRLPSPQVVLFVPTVFWSWFLRHKGMPMHSLQFLLLGCMFRKVESTDQRLAQVIAPCLAHHHAAALLLAVVCAFILLFEIWALFSKLPTSLSGSECQMCGFMFCFFFSPSFFNLWTELMFLSAHLQTTQVPVCRCTTWSKDVAWWCKDLIPSPVYFYNSCGTIPRP